MQADPALWQQDHGPFQQTPLDPIRERGAITPEIPPRNPSRVSSRKNSINTLPSVSSRYSISTHEDRLEEQDEPAIRQVTSDLPSPLDLISALSDTTIKDTAFKSLTQGSQRDQGIVWGGPHQRSDSVQLDNESYLDLHGKKLTTFKRGSIAVDHSPVSVGEHIVSDRLRALSFAQDYHNAISDQPFNDYSQQEQEQEQEQDEAPRMPPRDQELTPQPLTWSKEPTQSPPAEQPQSPVMPSSSPSGRYKNMRKMSSWVNHHLRKDSSTGVKQRSASDTAVLAQNESDVDRHTSYEARLASMVQHGKDLVSRKLLRRESEPNKPMVISHPMPHQHHQSSADPSVSATPFELATPVLRLPGGLTVVRQSPLNTPRPHTATDTTSSPFSDLSWADFPTSSPFRNSFSRRGSWASTHSQSAPGLGSGSPRLFGRKRSSPLASSTTPLRSFSYSITELGGPIPLAPARSHTDFTAPYSPPPTRRRSHNIGSPLSITVTKISSDAHPVAASPEQHASKPSILEKARLAHGAWKQHQKDARNEKIKQSIRLVGPAEATTDIAGYIKCAIEGRVSGDSGVSEGRVGDIEVAKGA